VSRLAQAAAHDAPGWYGKLAMLGDFAHRRLPAEFIAVSDAWLSRAMGASRTQLGDRWLDAYLTAPVLRFAWAPGIAGADWWFGLLMPSCDNVGRYYPLLIAQRRARPPLDRIAVDHLEAWFNHLATAATRTLDTGASMENFELALAQAPPWPTSGAPAPLVLSRAAGGERYGLGRRATLFDWLHGVVAQDLCERFAGCSVWWQKGDAGHEASATVVRRLPDPATFAAMLSGP
jgi:type VI secretion system protein ImpM